MKPKELERRLKELTRDRDRAQGVLSTLMEKLKGAFGCISVKKGEAKLERMKDHRRLLKIKCEKAIQQFEQEYGSKIGEE